MKYKSVMIHIEDEYEEEIGIVQITIEDKKREYFEEMDYEEIVWKGNIDLNDSEIQKQLNDKFYNQIPKYKGIYKLS